RRRSDGCASRGHLQGERARPRRLSLVRLAQSEPASLVQRDEIAEVLRLGQRRGTQEDLAVRERRVVTDDLALGERGERVEAERMDRLARATRGDRRISRGEVTAGGALRDAARHGDRGLTTDALAEAAAQQREDEDDQPDAEHADDREYAPDVERRQRDAGEQARDELQDEVGDAQRRLTRGVLADDLAQ